MSHDYTKDAQKYAEMGLDGTPYLAYRDLPKLLHKYDAEKQLLDFGCGTGRSTRYLKKHGFNVIGVDVDAAMLSAARTADLGGEYLLISEKIPFEEETFDGAISTLVFMEFSSKEEMVTHLKEINRILKNGAVLIIVVTSINQYRNETSSAQYQYPPDGKINSGEKITVRLKDLDIVITDYFWTENDYVEVFQKACFKLKEIVRPLGKENEPCDWQTEKDLSPWDIYVLQK